jgi:hypothetical protein
MIVLGYIGPEKRGGIFDNLAGSLMYDDLHIDADVGVVFAGYVGEELRGLARAGVFA